MALSPQRWSAIAESEFDWEREALAFLRQHLPDVDPWHVWSNFEFLDEQGRVNEVDALVLSPRGLFLVEIKSRPGRIEGDAHSWTWIHNRRTKTFDNPFLLANRKAKRLKSLLQRQRAFQRGGPRVPYVTALIFLSDESNDISALPPAVAANVFVRGQPGSAKDDGIIGALSGSIGPARDWSPTSDAAQRRACKAAMEEAGIRPSLSHRRVGDYDLGPLIEEGVEYQDFEGRHVAAPPFGAGSAFSRLRPAACRKMCARPWHGNSRSWRASAIPASSGPTITRKPSAARRWCSTTTSGL